MAPAQLPNLLVIGAMKCGTSSLHSYLSGHPRIAMSSIKEPNYFLPAEPTPAPGGEAEIALLRERSNADRGLEWYQRLFSAAPVRGESSVAYSFPWFPGVADRAAATLGDVLLIYMVRPPLERIVSHHAQLAGRDRRPLDEALAAPGNPYLEASRYRTALEPFLDRFGRERLLIVDAARLSSQRATTLARIATFLGLDPAFDPAALEQERNPTTAKGTAYRVAERLRAAPGGRAIAGLLAPRWRAAAERRLRSRRRHQVPPPSRAAAAAALAELEEEISGVEELTGWDLGSWRRLPPEPD